MQLSPYLHSVQVILTGKREIFALAINGSDTREPTCMSISGADIHFLPAPLLREKTCWSCVYPKSAPWNVRPYATLHWNFGATGIIYCIKKQYLVQSCTDNVRLSSVAISSSNKMLVLSQCCLDHSIRFNTIMLLASYTYKPYYVGYN